MKHNQQPRGNSPSATVHAQTYERYSRRQRRNGIAVDDGRGDMSLLSEATARTSSEDDKGPHNRMPASATSVQTVVLAPPATVRIQWFTRERMMQWLPFLVVLVAGALLRFWGLGDRPLHHDESLHAYFSMQLMHDMENWSACFQQTRICYRYNPLLHGPFQFHAIALVYKISQLLGAPDHGINTTTVRIAAATLGTLIVALPIFLRDYLGKLGAWLACFLLAVSPSMVYFSRFAREDIYMACFTLMLVVSVARYMHTRKMRWLVLAAVSFSLSYATKEATFLTIAVFGSFLGALIAWELGVRWHIRNQFAEYSPLARYWPKNAAPFTLVLYFLMLAPIAKLGLAWMNGLSTYVNAPSNQNAANAYVQHLKDNTLAILPWLGIFILLLALGCFLAQVFRLLPTGRRYGLARHIDPEQQPTLDAITMMPWTHWFFSLLGAVVIFVALFTVLLTNIKGGIGDGIWQGLYYWIQQQQVARGSQPWYYYFMLIPLYEQIGVVFGLIGIVRCLRHPSRFRLFLLYWFIGNVFIYSWAGEKMPWLMIHMTMPLMIVAAIGLEPLVLKGKALAVQWRHTTPAVTKSSRVKRPAIVYSPLQRVSVIASACLSIFLLVLTLQNMFQVTYVHAADGPHEMMIYVQTTPDVNIVMNKITSLDQKFYGGKHLLPIGVTSDAQWPFYWYLRDYTNVCYTFPTNCADLSPAVIISAGDSVQTTQTRYATVSSGKQPDYLFHKYSLRTWWDEGYKPPACVVTPTNTCQGQPTWGGVGPFLWMSYGDTPPPGATFNLGLALQHLWQWWWQRIPFGSTMGGTDMGLLIRNDLGMTP